MESRLSLATRIIHIEYKILICGYLYTLIKPNNTLQKLKLIDVFIIDQMSLLTNITLSSIYTRIKQSNVQTMIHFHIKLYYLLEI
jgi:hypothetical protein